MHNDQPETIADILAEMRREERPYGISNDRLRSYADRIEAAVERERDEDRQLAAIAESDEAFARCARCDRPERTPGNAAALAFRVAGQEQAANAAGATANRLLQLCEQREAENG